MALRICDYHWQFCPCFDKFFLLAILAALYVVINVCAHVSVDSLAHVFVIPSSSPDTDLWYSLMSSYLILMAGVRRLFLNRFNAMVTFLNVLFTV